MASIWPDDAIGGAPFWERENPGAITRIMQDKAALHAKFEGQRKHDEAWLERNSREPEKSKKK